VKNSLVSVENSDFIDGTVILSILEHCSKVMWRCAENQKSKTFCRFDGLKKLVHAAVSIVLPQSNLVNVVNGSDFDFLS
jgi:hypothetical protein